MLDVPDKIKILIDNEKYFIDDVGMSDSTVVMFDDKVLKIQTISDESENEYNVMKWLQGKLPVPKILAFDRDDKKNYLLMTKVSGEMSCSDKYMNNPEQLTTLLAEGLKMLWEIDVKGCPNIYHLDSEEELVLSHGDFCLPNIFLENGKITGFIDLGRAGVADKWRDIALCYRSLLYNFAGKYNGKKYPGFDKEMLFEKLGIEPNGDKIQYYIYLDNLIATGNTAEIFDVGEGKVLKLFKEGYSKEIVKKEFDATNLAVSYGKNVPKTYEMTKINGRYGFYMEKISGVSLLDMVMIGDIEPKRFMDLFIQCHKNWLTNTSQEPVSYKEWMINVLFGKENSSKLIAKIEKLPEGKVICHGDFHPGNIIIRRDGTPVIIDFANICKGPREYDIARTYCLLKEKVPNNPLADIYLSEMQIKFEEIKSYVDVIQKFRKYEMEIV